MPLRRTPPASPAPPTPTAALESVRAPTFSSVTSECESPLQHCESEPNLHAFATNVTERKKKKCDDAHLDVKALIREMFSTFSKQQEKRFQDLKSSL